mgnify:CR=1 FL=1
MIFCLSLSCLSDGNLVSAQKPGQAEKTAPPLYEFTFTDDQKREQTIEAAQILQAQDGGVVMLTRDGRLLTATPEQLKSKRSLDREFTPLEAGELEKQLKEEFGDDFTVTQTKHFTICSQAGKRYSQWCGYLFERLYMVLHNYWDDKAHPLHEPEVPLIAVIFKDRANFEQYASQILGDGAAATHGFYSIQSNRMVLYDLTAAPNERPAYTDADILFKLRKSPFNVATVIHECTHQIAFNVGLHTRFADNPLDAVRIPDVLISSDQRFQDAETILDTYAEAWAFSYFLIKTKRRQYEEYLRLIAARQPLIWSTPAERIKDFQSVFGEDLNQLDQQFIRYMRQISR